MQEPFAEPDAADGTEEEEGEEEPQDPGVQESSDTMKALARSETLYFDAGMQTFHGQTSHFHLLSSW